MNHPIAEAPATSGKKGCLYMLSKCKAGAGFPISGLAIAPEARRTSTSRKVNAIVIRRSNIAA
jgi:hypothetical protein